MHKTWLFALPIAAALSAAPVHAAILDATFTGTVASQTGTAFTIGSALSGEFIYNTATGTYGQFTIGGVSVAPGYASTASLTPDGNDAQYRAQISAVQPGGPVTNTFAVDLEALTPFASPVLPGSAVTLLTTPGLLATDLDLASNPNSLFPSTFGYSLSNANGTNVRQVTANLLSISVAVPEPSSVVLLAAACLALSLGAYRRQS